MALLCRQVFVGGLPALAALDLYRLKHQEGIPLAASVLGLKQRQEDTGERVVPDLIDYVLSGFERGEFKAPFDDIADAADLIDPAQEPHRLREAMAFMWTVYDGKNYANLMEWAKAMRLERREEG
jgi:hypothetical protein